MIFQKFAQLIITTALLEFFPMDIADLEYRTRFPESGPRTTSFQTVESWLTDQGSVFPTSVPAGIPHKTDPTRLGILTSAASALVVGRKSWQPLYQKNIFESRSIGSVTKLMTAFVFLETHPELTASAMIDENDIRLGGVQHLTPGERVTVRDLLLASLVGSDNSATTALVRLSGLSQGDFIARMNETAAEFGMTRTTFVDPTGLSSDNRSVAMDIAHLLDRVAEEEIIREATQQQSVTLQSASGKIFVIKNTNELLGSFVNETPYAIVTAKTGFLPEAGYCLGALFSHHNTDEILVVVLGAESQVGRFQDVKSLAVWTYDVYEW